MKTSSKTVVIAIILTVATILQMLPMSAFAALVEEFNKPEFYEPGEIEFVSDIEEETAEDAYIRQRAGHD